MTRRDVLLWWAFAEVKGTRWRRIYESWLGPELYQSMQYATFYQLTASGQDALLSALAGHRNVFTDKYLPDGGDYRFATLPVEQLGELKLLPEMNRPAPTRLKDFLAAQDISEQWPNDPRIVAREMAEAQGMKLLLGYPILVPAGTSGDYMLLEGYARCLAHLMRPMDDRVQVIACVA